MVKTRLHLVKQIAALLVGVAMAVSVTAQVKIAKTNNGVLVTEKGNNVLFYQVAQKSIDGKYERCNYIHPLWGIDGTILTEDFPADHLHQRGIFWAWHQILINGKSVGDGWAIIDYKQEVTKTETESLKDGSAVLKTEVNWLSDKWKNAGKEIPYLKENTTITIHPKRENYRKIDFEIRLLALAGNLKIGGADNVKGYSGFSARIVLPADVKFSGPNGEVIPENTAVESPGFVNISGAYGKGGAPAGLVLADNSENPMYPQKWILRKEKSMQNPVFPGREVFPVSTKEPLVLKYSLLVYTGKLTSGEIENILEEQ